MATTPADKPEDDQKAKFREALERKNKGASRPTGSKHASGEHVAGEHGPAVAKREFRRKSGG